MKTIKLYARISAVALTLLFAAVCEAADVVLLQSTVVDNNALNFTSSNPPTKFSRNINGRTFQRFPMATFQGYQYATYYDENRNVCLGRRKLPDGAWDVIRFTDYEITSSDAHNVVAVGICAKDGTIHLAFDHHAHPLNYRVSVQGTASDPENVTWSTNLFGSVTDQLGAVGYLPTVTYPTFFNAPNGNLMLYYRQGGSGNGDGMIQEYNGTTHDWTTGLGKFIDRSGSYSGSYTPSSSSRCPYINGISYAGTRLHASWGWRETSDNLSNHDLNYAYSDDDGRTWYNNDGTQIGTTGSSYITVNSPGLVVAAIPQENGLSNQYTHYAFADGSCHVMVEHQNTGGSQKYHHYWRNTSGVWSGAALSFDGSRPKLTGDDDGSMFLIYESGGQPRIAKGVPNAGQTAWSWSLAYTQNVSEGGEGQLDYSRWEADRVLTFYGQEDPPDSNETPSPLHVFDYKVSTKAILPVPANGGAVPILGTGMEWTAGIDAVSHQVYFGTNEQAVATATTASPEYQGQQSGTVFMPSPPPSSIGNYYWRIDEVQSDSTVTAGLIWQFTLTTADGVITQVVDQGSWDVASTWDPASVPVSGVDYKTSMQLRAPTNAASFAGDSLVILTGGELVLMNAGADTATVPNLVLEGGNLAAGVVDAGEAKVDGAINVASNAMFSGASDESRDLRVLSLVSGVASVELSAPLHTVYIDNANNTFSGVWEVSDGTGEFTSPGAVGSAGIDVQNGALRILGNWDGLSSGAALTVNDSAAASVDVGSNSWTVANLTIGSTSVTTGFVYTVSELNEIGDAVFSGAGTIQVGVLPPPPPGDLIVGWDIWDSGSAPSPSVLRSNITASAVTTSEGIAWHTDDERGASNDGTWGTHEGPPTADTTVGPDTANNLNLELSNGTTGGTITFAITNNSLEEIELGMFHFDAYAFRPDAARTYELSVLPGSDITEGSVFASEDDAITSVGGAWDNGAHDDIDIVLTGLADHILGAGESVQFLLAFSGGAGSGGGHDLWVDNVALTQVFVPTEPPVLEYSFSGDNLVFTWTGDGFKVQSRTNLTEGIWVDEPDGDMPPVIVDPVNAQDFFRLIEQ